jgi:putative transposase
VLRQFGTGRTHTRAHFDQFVRDGQTQPSIWHGLRNQIYLGDEQFVARMQSQIEEEKPLDEIPKVQRHRCRLSLEDFARQHGNQRSAMAGDMDCDLPALALTREEVFEDDYRLG